MKKLTILVALAVMMSPLTAQKNVDKHISFTGKESLALNIQIADSIAIHTRNKNEVYAKAYVTIDGNTTTIQAKTISGDIFFRK
ncbi:MAG TPA: hypothetical protein VJ203_09390 [Bacteroidales bacterium]|nr:hypothetical protein [Bacteroidales bacterium]